VSVTPRGLSFIKSTPISSSGSCTWRLKAGLRDPKLRSGFGEVQCVADRQKVSQMPQFHC
jgi:hypothetical protein